MLLLILVQLYGVAGFLCVDKAWPFFLELLYFPFQTYHKFILLLNVLFADLVMYAPFCY